jgi:hypothetical protein
MQAIIAILIIAATAALILRIHALFPVEDHYDYPVWVHRIALAIRSHWRAHA